MRIDQQGIQHPTQDDEVTLEGLQHISACEECRATFAGIKESEMRRARRLLGEV